MRILVLFISYIRYWGVCCAFAFPGYANIVSPEDILLAQKAFQHIEDKKISSALSAVANANDKTLLKLLLWMQYRHSYYRHNFLEISHFIQANPYWPRQNALEKSAENALTIDMPPEQVIRFFHGRDPVTARGMEILAAAKTLQKHPKESISKLILKAWVEGNFDTQEEKDFLKKRALFLTKEHHAQRIDRLLWERKIIAAKRMLPLLSDEHKIVYSARIHVIQDSNKLLHYLKKLPEQFKEDSGLLYELALHYYQKKHYKKVFDIISSIKEQPPYPEKWWRLKKLTIREFISQKRYEEAYLLASGHNGEAGNLDYAEAQWLAGWLALRFLDAPGEAYQFFFAMFHNVRFSISRARAAYWAGRAAEQNKNFAIAKKWYQVASFYPTTFYGQLAFFKLHTDAPLTLPSLPKITKRELQQYADNELLKAAYILMQVGYYSLAQEFLFSALEHTTDRKEKAYISEFGTIHGQNHISVGVAKQAINQGILLIHPGYPVLKNMPGEKSMQALILSVIRQESLFNSKAKSPANAMGLMQLLPGTAKKMAKKIHLPYYNSKLIYDPVYNITLGSTYLTTMLRYYNNSYLLTIASYNAGPGNVNKWIKKYGDPRQMPSFYDIIDWIELIPYAETRNYVQRVLENKQVYQVLLGINTPATTLTHDLTQGRVIDS